MKDLIERQAAIEEITYSIELCNKALDSMTLGGRDRYAVEVERNSLLKLKDDFKLLPSAQPEIIRCKDCKHGVHAGCGNTYLCVVSPEDRLEHKYDFWCAYAEMRADG